MHQLIQSFKLIFNFKNLLINDANLFRSTFLSCGKCCDFTQSAIYFSKVFFFRNRKKKHTAVLREMHFFIKFFFLPNRYTNNVNVSKRKCFLLLMVTFLLQENEKWKKELISMSKISQLWNVIAPEYLSALRKICSRKYK